MTEITPCASKRGSLNRLSGILTKKFSLTLFFIATLAVTGQTAAAVCDAGAPTGLFKGETNDGEEHIHITLNLSCIKGSYTAQFFTSQHDFAATVADGSDGHLQLSFNTGSVLGSAAFNTVGNALVGQLHLSRRSEALRLIRIANALPLIAMSPRLDLSAEEWRSDLKVFAEQLPKLHMNAFANLPRKRFDQDIDNLIQSAGMLNGDEMFVGLQRAANSIGDGHTGVVLPTDNYTLPIEIGHFGNEFRIVNASANLRAIIGDRIDTIDGMPITEAWRRALTVTPRLELMALREGRALSALSTGIILHGLDITVDRKQAVFGLADDQGRKLSSVVGGLKAGVKLPLEGVSPHTPLWKENGRQTFWCKELAQQKSVYCSFRGYPDIERQAAKMFALLDKVRPHRLIIDMRNNLGGDNTEGYRWLIQPLKGQASINKKGHLYVLVGAQTFSAAMNNAAQFQDETRATLVGQLIGERPNSYQEPYQFRLPNSHLVVRASTRYYKFRKHGENAVRPDKEIYPTWLNVKNGEDPALQWILAQPVP